MPDPNHSLKAEVEFLTSPALRFRSHHYPSRFNGQVTRLVKTKRTVRPDFPMQGAAAQADNVFLAWTNSHGAVAAILSDGNLGLKPSEFEVVEWADLSKLPFQEHAGG